MSGLNESLNGPGVGDPAQTQEPTYEPNKEPVVGDFESKPIANSPAPAVEDDEPAEDPEDE